MCLKQDGGLSENTSCFLLLAPAPCTGTAEKVLQVLTILLVRMRPETQNFLDFEPRESDNTTAKRRPLKGARSLKGVESKCKHKNVDAVYADKFQAFSASCELELKMNLKRNFHDL